MVKVRKRRFPKEQCSFLILTISTPLESIISYGAHNLITTYNRSMRLVAEAMFATSLYIAIALKKIFAKSFFGPFACTR